MPSTSVEARVKFPETIMTTEMQDLVSSFENMLTQKHGQVLEFHSEYTDTILMVEFKLPNQIGRKYIQRSLEEGILHFHQLGGRVEIRAHASGFPPLTASSYNPI